MNEITYPCPGCGRPLVFHDYNTGVRFGADDRGLFAETIVMCVNPDVECDREFRFVFRLEKVEEVRA